jgi:hypothetical protein
VKIEIYSLYGKKIDQVTLKGICEKSILYEEIKIYEKNFNKKLKEWKESKNGKK